MAKKKTKRRRSKKYISVYDTAVAYGNLTILTEGTTGYSPIGWFKGEYDLKLGESDLGIGMAVDTWKGQEQISMKDMLNEPGQAMNQIMANTKANWVGMTTNAILFNVGAKVLKKAMRQPIREANRLIRPLGMGVQI